MNRNRVIIMTAVLLIGMAMWLPGLRSRRVAAQSLGLKGSYGFSATAGGNSNGGFGIVGVITFDGAGNLIGSETVVSPDLSPNATDVNVQALPFTGTYTVNADGTGAMKVQLGPQTTIPVSIVITDGGASIMFVQTGGGNGLLTGTARKQ